MAGGYVETQAQIAAVSTMLGRLVAPKSLVKKYDSGDEG